MVVQLFLLGDQVMFTTEDIKSRIKMHPFVPLRIVMSSGQTFDIYHPDLILVGRRELTVEAPSSDDPTSYDRQSRVSIMHITALQDLPSPAPSAGNGEPKMP